MKLLSGFIALLLFAAPLVRGAASTEAVRPAPSDAVAKPKQWLIVLRLTPRLHDEKAWTDADNATVSKHFARLQEAAARGQVILAGRTSEPPAQTFGLIVLEAPDEAAARAFMTGDPCVAAGIMTGELHPYEVALLRK